MAKTVIRKYHPTDLSLLESWAKAYGIASLNEAAIPSTTYIAEVGGEPVVSLSMMLTNNREFAYLEYAIGNPSFASSEVRKSVFKDLVQWMEHLAKSAGYKRLVCLAPDPKLEAYYDSLGYKVERRGLSFLMKDLA